MPHANGLLSGLSQKEPAVFDDIYHCDVNVMVHAARRESDTSLFNTKHGTNMLTVRALHFHTLFDVRSFDHDGRPLRLGFLCMSKTPAICQRPLVSVCSQVTNCVQSVTVAIGQIRRSARP